MVTREAPLTKAQDRSGRLLRWIYVAAGGLAVLMLLCPPWSRPFGSGQKHIAYEWLFDPPGAADIDFQRLLLQLAALAVAVVVARLLLRR